MVALRIVPDIAEAELLISVREQTAPQVVLLTLGVDMRSAEDDESPGFRSLMGPNTKFEPVALGKIFGPTRSACHGEPPVKPDFGNLPAAEGVYWTSPPFPSLAGSSPCVAQPSGIAVHQHKLHLHKVSHEPDSTGEIFFPMMPALGFILARALVLGLMTSPFRT